MQPRTCRAPGCSAAINETHFYCRKDFETLLSGLHEFIQHVYDDAAVTYVGRTHYPERRLLQHCMRANRENLAVLHWSGDRRETEELEKRLIDIGDGLKCENRSAESDGDWSGHWYCLYISWSWKARARMWPSALFTDVEELDYGRRLVPDPPRTRLVKPPDYLSTPLSPEQAAQVLRAFDERRRAARR